MDRIILLLMALMLCWPEVNCHISTGIHVIKREPLNILLFSVRLCVFSLRCGNHVGAKDKLIKNIIVSALFSFRCF